MAPVDTFLQSVRAAFKPAEGLSAWTWLALALSLAVVAALARWWGRRAQNQQNEAAFAHLLLEKRVSTTDGAALVRMARAVALPPLMVATRLDAFERATARALVGQPPPATTPSGDDNDIFARVRRLRVVLGFHVVPDHVPLLTTRELVPGMPVVIDNVAATVAEVNEGWFAVLTGDAPLKPRAPGTAAFVTLTREHDARYQARCGSLFVQGPGTPRKAFFLHDEEPLRQQLRAAVRVNAQGTVVMVPGGAPGLSAAPAKGTLIDISVGGCAVETPAALSTGQALHLSITWAGETYRDLPASVLRCDARGSGFHARLAFHGLSADDDTRLSAAIARHSGRLAGVA